MKKIIITPIIFLMMAAAGFARELKNVAVLDFSARNISQSLADGIRDIFEVSLYKKGSFTVIERNQIDSILKEKNIAAGGCNEAKCAAQLGKLLSADIVIFGSVIKVKNYTIVLKYINSEDGTVALADSEESADEDGLRKAIDTLIARTTHDIVKTPVYTRKKKGEKRGWYFGLGYGAGYIWAVPEKTIYGIKNQGHHDFIFSIHLGLGGIVSNYFNIGYEYDTLVELTSGSYINEKGNKETFNGTLMVMNFHCVATIFPLKQGFFLKVGCGTSFISFKAESESHDDAYFGRIFKEGIYNGLGIIAGAGYLFDITDTYKIGLNADYGHQFYFFDRMQRSQFINCYVSVYFM